MYFKRVILKRFLVTLCLLSFSLFVFFLITNLTMFNTERNIGVRSKLDTGEQIKNKLTQIRNLRSLTNKTDAKGTKMNPVDLRYIDLVSKYLMDPKNKLGLPFLDNYQNPCWFTRLPADISSMYENNPLQYMNSKGLPHWMEKYQVVREDLINSKASVQLKCLPKVYLIGVHKCGTTDIFFKLLKHPQIFIGPKKEIHWWNLLRSGIRGNGTQHVPTFTHYIESFDNAARNIRKMCPGVKNDDDYHPCVAIDGSVRLLWYSPFVDRQNPNNPNLPPEEMIPAVLYKITPTAKLLVTLREPVSRCYSDYFYLHNGKVKDPELFHTVALSSLELMKNCIAENGSRYCAYSQQLRDKMEVRLQPSMYYIFFKDWLSIWPKKQIFIMELFEFSADRMVVFDKVTDFLEIDRFPRDMATNINIKPPSNYNPPSKSGDIWPETKEILTKFFQPYNDMLAGLLGDEKYRWK